jgi:Fe-S cluster assembly protein SufD
VVQTTTAIDITRTKIGDFSSEKVEALSQVRGEPAWLTRRRVHAWRVFEGSPLPTAEEIWRKVDLSHLDLDSYTLAPGAPNSQPTPPTERNSGVLYTRDAGVADRTLAPELESVGVIFTTLQQAVLEHPELVEPYLEAALPADGGKFDALNAALWTGGTFLYVPAGVEAALPLRAISHVTRAGELILPRLLLVAEEAASVALLEDFESETLDSPSVAIPVAEIVLKPGAKVRHVVLQRWGRNFTHLAHQRALVGDDAFLHSLSIGLGSRLSKTNMESGLTGRGGGSELLGIFLGDESQVFDENTFQEHIGPDTYSNLLYKAALRDSSSSNYYGVIHIRPSAQRSNAYQADRNVLLGERAKADSVPVLEIEANDVKCTHGAAVGPVDEEHRFYLTSRGVPPEIAEQLIVFGFFHEVLDRFPDEVVRRQIDRLVATKMGVHVEEAE